MTQELLYYGEVISVTGLEPVAKALAGCSWHITLHQSAYDGTLYLRSLRVQPEIDLQMDSGQFERFRFSGAVGGAKNLALALLGDFSRCLKVGGFIHRLELLDGSKILVGYFHHQWPQSQPEPISSRLL